jgi:tryptophanase
MGMVKFYKGGDMPLELHKVRVVQKLHLVPVERRLEAMKEGADEKPEPARPIM